jgi:serine/threonine-protein kinase RsbW
MDDTLYRFQSLDTLIEEVHTLFDQWERSEHRPPAIALRTMYLVKLAVHEWVANLIQHASFNHAPPQVQLRIRPSGSDVCCMIADNSDGFDLQAYFETAPSALQAFPERGTGLLILQSCTEELSYERTSDGFNRLSFRVSADQDSWLSILY